MIDEAQFVNDNGQYIYFNTDDIPFTKFESTVDIRSQEDEKAQEHGLWDNYMYLGKRVTRAEGDLFGRDSAEYVTKRRRMIRCLMPFPTRQAKVIGTLYLKFAGMNERVYTRCTLDGYPELPIEALSPSRGAYQVSWKSNDPILYGEMTQSVTLATAVVSAVGITLPHAFPITFPIDPALRTSTWVGGDVETFPAITFLGPAIDPGLTIFYPDLSSATFKLKGLSLDEGQTAVADLRTRIVTSGDGSANYYSFTTGTDWFYLLPDGQSVLRYTPGWSASPSSATVSWHNAYML